MSIHSGHRERLRRRFQQEGLENFEDIQILELLLFYCIPRQDTNPIAHRLLDHFGSLSQVMDASAEELRKIPGVGEQASLFLSLINQLFRAYQKDRSNKPKSLPTLESCAHYMKPYFFGQSVESAYLLCLDAKSRPLCCKKLSQGNVNSTEISIRKIVETALSANASSVLLAHNHPGGIAIPSYEDICTTMNLSEALKSVEIRFIDHLVICEDDYVSLIQSGYFVGASGGTNGKI